MSDRGCSSKRQTRTATSTAESELIAQSTVAPQAEGIAMLLREGGVATQITAYCDNTAALAQIGGTTTHLSRHTAIISATLRDIYAERVMDGEYVCSAEQEADIMTKCLQKTKHKLGLRLLGMRGRNVEEVKLEDEEISMLTMDLQQEMMKAAVTLVSSVVENYVRDKKDGVVPPNTCPAVQQCPELPPVIINEINWGALVAAAMAGSLCTNVMQKIRTRLAKPESVVSSTISRGSQAPCTYEWDRTQPDVPGRFKYLGTHGAARFNSVDHRSSTGSTSSGRWLVCTSS